ncbi:MAG TPA: ATP-binding protein [Methylophilaceae bacterium]|jgi:two-component system sensor histidine kinase RegB
MHRTKTLSATTANLNRLFWLRNVAIIGQWTALVAAQYRLHMHLPVIPLIATICTLMLLNVMTFWRLAEAQRISDNELLLQLLADVLLLTVLLYFSGGYTNPFVWMYLLPLTIAAVALPWAYTWGVAALSVCSYSLLMFYYRPLSMMQMDIEEMSLHGICIAPNGKGFSLHLMGMWFGFVLSACIIAYFVARMGQTLREYDGLMAQAREKALESERLLALGTLATAAAHELGTPLATMAIVTGELLDSNANQPALAEPLSLLRVQIQRCKEILTSITASAGQPRIEDGQALTVSGFLQQSISRWQDTRPTVMLDVTLQGIQPVPSITVDRALGQALNNLLDNAADASPQHIALSADWDNVELTIRIRDFGAGLSPEALENVGSLFFTTKQEDGHGLGLYLARLIFARFGGTVSLSNHVEGGVETLITLPLKQLLLKVAS